MYKRQVVKSVTCCFLLQYLRREPVVHSVTSCVLFRIFGPEGAGVPGAAGVGEEADETFASFPEDPRPALAGPRHRQTPSVETWKLQPIHFGEVTVLEK